MIIDHSTPADLPRLRQLWQQAFGDPDAFLDAFFAVGYAPERSLCIRLGGEIAAMLYWFDCDVAGEKLAYLYAVATDRAFQGQGLCHALMENAHGHLAQLGYAGAVLVPGSESLFRFYEKMGYHSFGGIREFSADAGSKVSVAPITVAEYIRLRQQYLPESSVVQAGPLMAFLATQARFYRGEDFLLCCTLADNALSASELLGSADAAGIVAALNCKNGTFRTPGEKPFAMFRPLRNDAAVPEYFAFALD